MLASLLLGGGTVLDLLLCVCVCVGFFFGSRGGRGIWLHGNI